MTCTQLVHLFVECGLLTDGQVLIKAVLSLLCHSMLDTGGGLDLWAHGARWEQPGLSVSSTFTFSFLILMDLQYHIVFSPSWALYLAMGSVLSVCFLVRLVASAALLSERLSPLSKRGCFGNA